MHYQNSNCLLNCELHTLSGVLLESIRDRYDTIREYPNWEAMRKKAHNSNEKIVFDPKVLNIRKFGLEGGQYQVTRKPGGKCLSSVRGTSWKFLSNSESASEFNLQSAIDVFASRREKCGMGLIKSAHLKRSEKIVIFSKTIY